MDIDINQVLHVYLGTQDGGYQPVGCDDRLRTAFPKNHEAMAELVSVYLAQDHALADWAGKTLEEEADRFAEKLRSKFPELDATSIQGLAARWSYGWR